jgi:hypothetical protein
MTSPEASCESRGFPHDIYLTRRAKYTQKPCSACSRLVPDPERQLGKLGSLVIWLSAGERAIVFGGPKHHSGPPPHRFRYDSSDPVPRDHAGTCPGRPGSPLASVRDGLTVPSDRSCGLFSGAGHWAHPRRLYSQQPPSSRTSTSRCIRLYVPPTTTAP